MRKIPECVACGNHRLLPFLDMGWQPLANGFHASEESLQPHYPLCVVHCGQCGHKQLTQAVPPDRMFKMYPYRSGVSETLRADFQRLAMQIRARYGDCRVLDIACNDGTFLQELEAVSCQAVGIDPALNLIEEAKQKGLNAHCGYWTKDTAETLGQFDVITALNVLAHTDDPLSFLLDCRRGLKPGGTMIVQTSQVDWIEKGEFDCVYHEHVSYFTESSMRRLAQRAGFDVANVYYPEIHGKSLRVFLSDPLGTFAARFNQSCEAAQESVAKWRLAGYAVWGYGAAAKGNMRLNTAHVCLDAIVDDTEGKQGMFTPGMNIPVISGERLREKPKLAVVVMAWNFLPEIMQKTLAAREGLDTVFIDARTWQEVTP